MCLHTCTAEQRQTLRFRKESVQKRERLASRQRAPHLIKFAEGFIWSKPGHLTRFNIRLSTPHHGRNRILAYLQIRQRDGPGLCKL